MSGWLFDSVGEIIVFLQYSVFYMVFAARSIFNWELCLGKKAFDLALRNGINFRRR